MGHRCTLFSSLLLAMMMASHIRALGRRCLAFCKSTAAALNSHVGLLLLAWVDPARKSNKGLLLSIRNTNIVTHTRSIYPTHRRDCFQGRSCSRELSFFGCCAKSVQDMAATAAFELCTLWLTEFNEDRMVVKPQTAYLYK